MKKTLLSFFVGILLVSCSSSVPEDLTTKQIIKLSAANRDWIEHTEDNGLNRYYSCYFSMPEISDYIYTNGSVIAYVDFQGSQQILPYVRHYENANGNLWTRTVDYEYRKGGITFYVTNSDFAIDQPDAMDFRVVLMW